MNMEKNVVVREEGRDGLLYALDCNNRSVAASSAAPHQYYICAFCKAEMVLTSRNGEPYFALRKGFIHNHPVCMRMTARGTREKVFKVSPDKFIDQLCHGVFPHGDRRDTHEKENNKNPKGPISRTPSRFITSLSQIYSEGLYLLAPETQRGEYTIGEFLMSFKALDDYLSDPAFKLGARIIHSRFMYYCTEELMLIFTTFNENNEMHFAVNFPDKKDYYYYRSLLMEDMEVNGKRHFKIKPKMDALIASRKWDKFEKDCVGICKKQADDHCKRCKGLYYTVFTSERQLYLTPAETEGMM